jgi:hypothetical protein
MVNVLITVLVVCLIVGLIYYVVDALGVPDPLNKVAKVIAVVVGCLIIIMLLLGLAGVNTGLPVR